jgi:hypothetical protein
MSAFQQFIIDFASFDWSTPSSLDLSVFLEARDKYALLASKKSVAMLFTKSRLLLLKLYFKEHFRSGGNLSSDLETIFRKIPRYMREMRPKISEYEYAKACYIVLSLINKFIDYKFMNRAEPRDKRVTSFIGSAKYFLANYADKKENVKKDMPHNPTKLLEDIEWKISSKPWEAQNEDKRVVFSQQLLNHPIDISVEDQNGVEKTITVENPTIFNVLSEISSFYEKADGMNVINKQDDICRNGIWDIGDHVWFEGLTRGSRERKWYLCLGS